MLPMVQYNLHSFSSHFPLLSSFCLEGTDRNIKEWGKAGIGGKEGAPLMRSERPFFSQFTSTSPPLNLWQRVAESIKPCLFSFLLFYTPGYLFYRHRWSEACCPPKHNSNSVTIKTLLIQYLQYMTVVYKDSVR